MRHAFCIMAFNDYEQLIKMLKILDSEKSDFYIHINALADMPDCNRIKEEVCKSKVYFTKRVPIVWGENGVLMAELVLLETAMQQEPYDYYHMLSGQDFPLKPLRELDTFLEENVYNNPSGRALTNYMDVRIAPSREIRERLTHYNWLIRYWRYPNKAVRGIIRGVNLISHVIQRIFGVNRLDMSTEKVGYGSVWYSISYECTKYICENRTWFAQYFTKHSFAPDEGAIQTLIMNSELKNTIYEAGEATLRANLRYDDYTRGNGASPYIFRETDFEELKNNKNFFARKFSETVDDEIICKLHKYVERDL